MKDLLITNARIITPDNIVTGWLHVQNGKIAAIGSDAPPEVGAIPRYDAAGLTLLPGLIDVHVHGAVGADTMDADPDSLRKMSAFFARQGVTGFLPTTLTSSHEDTLAALQVIKSLMDEELAGATVLGCHLEGPYLNLEKCGAQNKDYIRRVEESEAMAYLDMDVIRVLSLAPEFKENHWLIYGCVASGIRASAAHTNATYAQMQVAIAMGVTQATHTFNAMTGLHHREPGVLGAVMESDTVLCELIADNIHVHPAAMNVLYKVKSPHHIVLITDSMRAAGMGDGHYRLGEYDVKVADGQATLVSDGTLAGSIVTLNRALYNFMQATGQPLRKVWQMASLNPAVSAGVSHKKGSIEVGKDADMILVDAETIDVKLTVVGGRIVYDIHT